MIASGIQVSHRYVGSQRMVTPWNPRYSCSLGCSPRLSRTVGADPRLRLHQYVIRAAELQGASPTLCLRHPETQGRPLDGVRGGHQGLGNTVVSHGLNSPNCCCTGSFARPGQCAACAKCALASRQWYPGQLPLRGVTEDGYSVEPPVLV